MNLTMKLSKRLSFGEEVANAVTHAVGSVLTLILLPLSAIYSYEVHGLLSAIGVSIFVISIEVVNSVITIRLITHSRAM